MQETVAADKIRKKGGQSAGHGAVVPYSETTLTQQTVPEPTSGESDLINLGGT